MIARLQQFITAGVLVLALSSAALLALSGRFVAALAVILSVALGHAVVLAAEFALLVRANRRDPAPGAGVRQLIRAWWNEAVLAPQVFCWEQPFRSRAQPDHLPPTARGLVGVVFVHGYVCNRGFWNPWLKRLRARGTPFVAVNLEPPFGSIDQYNQVIDNAVRQVQAATECSPLIVAHSMGGLAVRSWMAAMVDTVPVRHVLTLGTPHRGTLLARLGRTRNARQMRPGSPWLRALAQREPPSHGANFTCIYSHCDNIVIPASAATLDGADNQHLAGVAHVDLARQEAVFREILRWVEPER